MNSDNIMPFMLVDYRIFEAWEAIPDFYLREDNEFVEQCLFGIHCRIYDVEERER